MGGQISTINPQFVMRDYYGRKCVSSEYVDTFKTPHTGENLKDLAITAIKKVKEKFNDCILIFVTDNANSMVNMKKSLETKDKDCIDVMYYGCSAHILNLLAKDFDLVSEKILN